MTGMETISVKAYGQDEAEEFARALDACGITDKIWVIQGVIGWIRRDRTIGPVKRVYRFQLGNDAVGKYFISETTATGPSMSVQEFRDNILEYNQC